MRPHRTHTRLVLASGGRLRGGARVMDQGSAFA